MLNRRVAITIPGTNHGKPISQDLQDAKITVALRYFSLWFGGATAIKGQGGWLDSQGQLITENVVVVYSYCDDHSLAKHRKEVQDYARLLAQSLGQDCVAVEWPEGMDFISQQAEAA